MNFTKNVLKNKEVSVSQFLHANQFDIDVKGVHYLQSYDSVVCAISDKIYLLENYDYSNTTIKHLYGFIRKYAGFSVYRAKDLKKLIKNGDAIVKA